MGIHQSGLAAPQRGASPAEATHFDVLIVGAGLSGIGAAAHLQMKCPDKSYAIMEARDALGGTWDLFRYPGIRSDSDMYTLGYSFKPWTDPKAIAGGPSIRSYIAETARERGIDKHILFSHKIVSADWSAARSLWTVEARKGEETVHFTCGYLLMCSGYYSYAEGYRPTFAGESQFKGQIIHPQFWPENLDYKGKRVVIIGSGATAVTLLPEMARDASHVVMLQRSPSYVVSRPSQDSIAESLKRRLPSMLAYQLVRWKNVLLGMFFFRLARKKPQQVKERMIGWVRDHLGPDYDVEKHFTPSYNPWDQRVCAVPDGDLFRAIRKGKASVETDTIDTFTENGIRLASGKELDADIVVTATGLKLNLLGDVAFSLDGKACDMSRHLVYKGFMFSGIPNLGQTFGYTNASWTLKADLTAEYMCRLLNYMDKHGYTAATPRPEAGVEEEPFLDFSSGYVQRALDMLPKQGSKRPWKLYQNYALDMLTLRLGRLDDGSMDFSSAPASKAEAPVPAAAEKRSAA
ncbi:MAG: NAD(P)/FAD-dependent oxidoreductase [Parvibaculaceae bacterium]|nr:NAD(P)/FAD-dependent oxidoreductase [Parvibaculaceae bacterium]